MPGSSGSALGADRGSRNGRLSALQKVERDQRIVLDRNRGLTWPMIAERHGLSERQCRAVYTGWCKGETARLWAVDPGDWVVETIARHESLIGTLAEIVENADNDAARVGARRTQSGLLIQLASLLVAAGVLPRNLTTARDRDDLVAAVERIMKVIERHNLGSEILQELAAVLDDVGRTGAKHALALTR